MLYLLDGLATHIFSKAWDLSGWFMVDCVVVTVFQAAW